MHKNLAYTALTLLTGVSLWCLPATAGPATPLIITSIEEGRSFLKSKQTQVRLATRSLTVIRKGNQFIVQHGGDVSDESLNQDQFLNFLKLISAQNHTLSATYLSMAESKDNIAALKWLGQPSNFGHTLVAFEDLFSPVILENYGPQRVLIISSYAEKPLEMSQADFKKLGSAKNPESEVVSCQSNLRNLATALELYAGDNAGTYPSKLDTVCPKYLKTVPQCPAASQASYDYQVTDARANFTVTCAGHWHKKAGLTENHPLFDSFHGGQR